MLFLEEKPSYSISFAPSQSRNVPAIIVDWILATNRFGYSRNNPYSNSKISEKPSYISFARIQSQNVPPIIVDLILATHRFGYCRNNPCSSSNQWDGMHNAQFSTRQRQLGQKYTQTHRTHELCEQGGGPAWGPILYPILPPSLTSLMVSLDVKHHERRRKRTYQLPVSGICRQWPLDV